MKQNQISPQQGLFKAITRYKLTGLKIFLALLNEKVPETHVHLTRENIWIILVRELLVLLDFWLTAKAATLIFISGHGSAISSA